MSWYCPNCEQAHRTQYDDPTFCDACLLEKDLLEQLEEAKAENERLRTLAELLKLGADLDHIDINATDLLHKAEREIERLEKERDEARAEVERLRALDAPRDPLRVEVPEITPEFVEEVRVDLREVGKATQRAAMALRSGIYKICSAPSCARQAAYVCGDGTQWCYQHSPYNGGTSDD